MLYLFQNVTTQNNITLENVLSIIELGLKNLKLSDKNLFRKDARIQNQDVMELLRELNDRKKHSKIKLSQEFIAKLPAIIIYILTKVELVHLDNLNTTASWQLLIINLQQSAKDCYEIGYSKGKIDSNKPICKKITSSIFEFLNALEKLGYTSEVKVIHNLLLLIKKHIQHVSDKQNHVDLSRKICLLFAPSLLNCLRLTNHIFQDSSDIFQTSSLKAENMFAMILLEMLLETHLPNQEYRPNLYKDYNQHELDYEITISRLKEEFHKLAIQALPSPTDISPCHSAHPFQKTRSLPETHSTSYSDIQSSENRERRFTISPRHTQHFQSSDENNSKHQKKYSKK